MQSDVLGSRRVETISKCAPHVSNMHSTRKGRANGRLATESDYGGQRSIPSRTGRDRSLDPIIRLSCKSAIGPPLPCRMHVRHMRRTFRYRLYPTRSQDIALHGQVDEACRLYNAALEERRSAWKAHNKALTYYDQASQLKTIRACGDSGVANFSASQDVLRRVDRTFAAFAAFFAGLKTGQRTGHPRFKPRGRYRSLTFPSWRDGCRLT